jgi:hypothetical protein
MNFGMPERDAAIRPQEDEEQTSIASYHDCK